MGKINKVKKIWVPVQDKIQDKELLGDVVIALSVQCLNCKHFRKQPITCDAYKSGIPREIIDGNIDHSKPYDNDNGIQYKEIILK